MSNDKLAEALEHTARHRAATEGIDPDQWRVVLFKWEALALKAHAAEAAQPMTPRELAARVARGEKWEPATEAAQAQSGEWVLVPRKITPEMKDAADRRDDEEPPSDWGKMRDASRQAIWSAMLAAAPHPQPAQDAKLPSDEDFRLHLGELTSAELRVAQAAFRYAMAKESGR